MKKQMILWTCILLLVLAGCKKDDVQYTDRYELKGKVEKGPFVRGSEVTVYELSERLERTGISYTKTVQDDQGNFDFGILDIRSPYVEIVATGADRRTDLRIVEFAFDCRSFESEIGECECIHSSGNPTIIGVERWRKAL